MTEKDVVILLNSLNLGLTADFGYNEAKANGIWVRYTLDTRTSQHTRGKNIQVIVGITEQQDGYLKGVDIVNKIVEALEKQPSVISVNHVFTGSYENKYLFSINLSTGGMN